MRAYLSGTREHPGIVLSFAYDAVHAQDGTPLREWVRQLPGRTYDTATRSWVITATGENSPAEVLGAAGFVAVGPDDIPLDIDEYAKPLAYPDTRLGLTVLCPRLLGRESLALELPDDAVWREREKQWLIPTASFTAWAAATHRPLDNVTPDPSGENAPDEPEPAAQAPTREDIWSDWDNDGSQTNFNSLPDWEVAGSSPDLTPEPSPEPLRLTPVDEFAYDGSIDGLRAIPVGELSTVGTLTEESLNAVGVESVWDLLHYAPRRYIDLSAPELATAEKVGEKLAMLGTVVGVYVGDGKRPSKLNVRDAAGTIVSCVFFNADWMMRKYAKGQRVIIFGKLSVYSGRTGDTFQMQNPLVSEMDTDTANAARDDTDNTSGGTAAGAGMIPVYPASGKAALNTWQVHRAAREAVSKLGELADPIPAVLLERRHLIRRVAAYRALHAPETPAIAETGRTRLAYDELLRLQLTLLTTRASEVGGGGVQHRPSGALLDKLIASLPFPLTGAQSRALSDIRSDLVPNAHSRSKLIPRRPMNRLLQGDVGVGKTMVAMGALLMAIEGGFQGVLMAPTEILASQHYAEVAERLDGLPVRVELLTNKVTGKRRKDVISGLADGTINLVVGTHALLADAVVFHKLGLAVIDEQHRFGVEQRAALRAKGPTVNGIVCVPDVLMATATPIPRTAVMTIFGDMEVSLLDEMPPGRTPILTTQVEANDAKYNNPEAAPWALLREQVSQGRQAFVVCPLVGDSETKAATAANTVAESLGSGALRGMRIGVVHGKQKGEERAETMARFSAGDLDVLVATTVIEVGVNVPNATVMVVIGAENFGLSQLHQIRGRVGRGKHAGHCVLVGSPKTEDGRTRLAAMCETTDGFKLSEVDLAIRGFGTLLGGSQSGTPTDFRVADILADADIVAWAKQDAVTLTDGDVHLARRPQLRDEIRRAVGEQAAEWLISA